MSTTPKWKLLLIPALALLFIVILTSDDDAEESVETSAPAVVKAPLPVDSKKEPHAKSTSLRLSHSLSDLIDFNPFQRPARLAPNHVDDRPGTAIMSGSEDSPSEDIVVQAIVHRSGKPVAIVNGRIMVAGDKLADGRRIVEITAEAIKLGSPSGNAD